jgi:hypothetical protein
MHPAELEALVDRELRQLPLPRAPRTLLPRVMAAVQQWTQRPWYQRAWFTWPWLGQAAALTALTALLAAAFLVLPGTVAGIADAIAPHTARIATHTAVLTRSIGIVTTAGQVFWRTLLEPIVPYAFAVAALMFVACLAFGTALNHLVLERAMQR